MESAPVIIFVGLLVFLAHLFSALFERTRVPDVVYLIVIGLIIGPLMHIVSPKDFGLVGNIFTTITLVVILFEGGLELSFESLRQSMSRILKITFISYFIAFGLLLITIILVTTFELPIALFVAAVLAGPAPSVVIPLVRQLKIHDSTKTTLMLESPLGEALCIVVALGIVEAIHLNEIHVGKLMGTLISSFVFAVVIGAIGGYFWSILLHKIRNLRHAILTTPAFVFIVYGVTEFLHFSGPVSALTFGIILGNAGAIKIPWIEKNFPLSPLHHNETEKLFFGEIVFLLKTFFFVYMGLSIRFTDLWSMGVALALTGALLLSRISTLVVTGDRNSTTIDDVSLMAVLIPKGTAAAVLASLLVQLEIPGGETVQNVIYSVVVISIILSSFLIFMVEKGGLKDILKVFFNGYKTSLDTGLENKE